MRKFVNIGIGGTYMRSLKIIFPALVAGMLLLSACAGVATQEPTQGVETFIASTPTVADISTATTAPTEPVATEMATAEASATALPTQANTAIPGIPATGGPVEALSEILRYRVVDNAGTELGMVRDYIINTCEAHILYIVLDAPNGSQSILVPYEAVSLNPGRPQDAPANALVVNFDAALLSSAPAIDLKTVNFDSDNWDANVMSFWRQNIAISLTTACNVPTRSGTLVPTPMGTLTPGGTLVPSGTAPAATATPPSTLVPSTEVPGTETPVASLNGYNNVAFQATSTPPNTVVPATSMPGTGTPITTLTPSNRVNVFKVALASELIGANVVDINNNPLAKVRDALVLKSTGGVQYFIVQLVAGNQQEANGNMMALPPGAVNLFYGTEFMRNTPVVGSTASASGTMAAATPAAGTPVGGETVDNDIRRGSFDRPVLVLLFDLSVLTNAPAYSLTNGQMDQATFDYWSQYVPMTREALP
jgi:sporulation protein YlmC with PRC-barrel domain